MHCELLAPGLFAAPGELRLPSLELLLARGRCTSAGSQGVEGWLQEAFELGDAPLAAGALTLLGANGEPGERFWMRADPVHLRLMRDRLVLAPAAALRIPREEAAALCQALNLHFSAQLGLQMIIAAPRNRRRRGMHVGCEIRRGAAVQVQRIHIAAGRAEVAHDSGDERHPRSIARHLGHRQLLARIGRSVDDARSTALGERIQLRGPPVIVAVAGRGRPHEPFALATPVIFVDE